MVLCFVGELFFREIDFDNVNLEIFWWRIVLEWIGDVDIIFFGFLICGLCFCIFLGLLLLILWLVDSIFCFSFFLLWWLCIIFLFLVLLNLSLFLVLCFIFWGFIFVFVSVFVNIGKFLRLMVFICVWLVCVFIFLNFFMLLSFLGNGVLLELRKLCNNCEYINNVVLRFLVFL